MNTCLKTCVMSLAILVINFGSVMADEVQLKNGDRISGQVVIMEDDKLIFKTPYAGKITIIWKEVSNLRTEQPVEVVLSDKTTLRGITRPGEEGQMEMETKQIAEAVSFMIAQVESINKPPEPAVKIKTRANAGLNVSKGNTDTEAYHIDAEFIARTAKNRYTVGAEYNRKEDDGEKTADNFLGCLEYDHFRTKKWYLNNTASFEKDDLKDLNLRTTIGLGAGYQFFETPLTNLSVEAGAAYVDEDYDVKEDREYTAGRWALNYDRYLIKKIVQFFHAHEGFVSLENSEDIFVRTKTGLRFPLYRHFRGTIQYDLDWDNCPSVSAGRYDYRYMFTLGIEY